MAESEATYSLALISRPSHSISADGILQGIEIISNFQRFPLLAPELRIRIWEDAIAASDGSLIYRNRPLYMDSDPRRRAGLTVAPGGNPRSAIACVNWESNQVYLRCLSFIYTEASDAFLNGRRVKPEEFPTPRLPRPFGFSLRYDIFVETWMYWPYHEYLLYNGYVLPEVLDNGIERLAVCYSRIFRKRHQRLDFEQKLRLMKSLKVLHVIVRRFQPRLLLPDVGRQGRALMELGPCIRAKHTHRYAVAFTEKLQLYLEGVKPEVKVSLMEIVDM